MAQARKKLIRPGPPPKPAAAPAAKFERWRVPGICLGLAALTFAVFGQTLHHEFFNFDDADYVYDNPVVRQGLTFHGLAWAFTTFHAGNWHPLTWLSHELDCQLFGLHPGGHHLTNVLIHTATVILLFLVLRAMTGAFWRCAFVAAVFAIHPLRVESVAWVAERKDVLSGLFFVLTIWAYVRYVDEFKVCNPESIRGKSSRFATPKAFGARAFYALSIFFFVLGLMSKPMLVTLPVVLFLLDYWPLQRMEAGKLAGLVLEKLPFLALSAAGCVTTLLAQHGAMQSTASFPWSARAANALVTCATYLGQLIWPAGLVVLYPYSRYGPPVWAGMLSGLLLAGLSALTWWQRRKQPWLLMGWLWYLVMLLPVVGLIQVGEQAHADRYTYLPQIGIVVAVTWLGAQWGAQRQAGRALTSSVMAGVVMVLAVCAWRQTGYWKNSETLWRRDLACTQRNESAHYNLGNALHLKGKLDEAIFELREALQILPSYESAHYNLGIALLEKGEADEAIVQFQEALAIRPDDVDAHIDLATVLLQRSEVDEAILHAQEAVKLRPDSAEAHASLGGGFMRKGKVDEAMAQMEIALRLQPDYADGHFNLGLALLQKGRVDEALAHFQKAPQVRRNNAKTQNNIGLALLQYGKTDEAIARFQIAVQLKPGEAEYQRNLRQALEQKGRAGQIRAPTP